MRFGNDSFTEFTGCRNTAVEEKIEECLAAAKRGETSARIDRGDLTDAEVEYLQREMRRRLRQ